MPVQIKGNTYITVAERIAELHAKAPGGVAIQIETDIVAEDAEAVTVKAVVVCGEGTFHGHARSNKKATSIEGQSPLEVAETSAVGRALGFAGYGSVESIASAEEVIVAQQRTTDPDAPECMHGKRRFWEGNSKSGHPIKGWMCAASKDKCKTLWMPDPPEVDEGAEVGDDFE